MMCTNCSTPVPDDPKFCLNCGSLVSDAEGQSAATAAMDASATQKMKSLLSEDTKNDYIIVELLGKAAMAAVYLAMSNVLAMSTTLWTGCCR